MTGKTVQFKQPAKVGTDSAKAADEWVAHRGTETKTERMKRFTIDVPLSLHTRIKTQCAMRGVKMADEIRVLLEEKFPKA